LRIQRRDQISPSDIKMITEKIKREEGSLEGEIKEVQGYGQTLCDRIEIQPELQLMSAVLEGAVSSF
jgi:hypothetical protein